MASIVSGRRITNRWTGATGSDFRIKRIRLRCSVAPWPGQLNRWVLTLSQDMKLKHELWKDIGGDEYSEYTFCLAGPRGDDARKSLSPEAQLIWTVEADTHFAAMTAYYKFMGWGVYTTDQEWDMQPYPAEWSQT
jgi:hypothetical protein